VVDHSDNVWGFWRTIDVGIWYRRFLRAPMAWESAATQVPGTMVGDQNLAPAAVSDPDGGISLFWQSNRSGNADIWSVRQDPVTQVWGEPQQMTTGTEADSNPFALRGPDGSLWLFWGRDFGGNGELFYRGIFRSV
jgi:hypothetical protein